MGSRTPISVGACLVCTAGEKVSNKPAAALPPTPIHSSTSEEAAIEATPEAAESTPESRQAHRRASFTVLATVFVVALCGLGYELLAGTVSSYFLGNTILQFSITIGVFLSAMGLGSYLSGKVTDNVLRVFLLSELGLALVGGFSSFFFFAVYTYLEHLFYYVFFGILIFLGTLTGLEIPLLVRLYKEYGGWKLSLAKVLSVDYVGALAASIIFPLLLLPYLGLMHASFFFGLLNLLAGLWFAGFFREELKLRFHHHALIVLVSIALLAGFAGSSRLVHFFENTMYTDEILTTQQTPYQRLVLTRYKDDLRLYIDGNLQFCSLDEYRYHEALVHPAMNAAGKRRKVLILGGGDGLAVREVLKYSDVESIRLVDLDPAVVKIARENLHLKKLNEGSLSDPRVEVIHADAFQFLQNSEEFYDVILVDLPDPHNYSLSKLYSRHFYQLISRRLEAQGVMCVQSTSPYYAGRTYWCIADTITAAGFHIYPLHVNVPSLGDWGFVLASLKPLDKERLFDLQVPTKFLNEEQARALFSFAADLQRPEVEINTLNNGQVVQYYDSDWGKWR